MFQNTLKYGTSHCIEKYFDGALILLQEVKG